MNRKGSPFSKRIALLLCICLLAAGPIHPLTASANMDPSVFSDGSGSASSEAEPQQAVEQKKTTASSAQSKYQDEIDAINDKLANLEEQKKALQSSISQTKSAKEQEVAKKNAIDEQISITQGEIALLLSRIGVLEEEIAEKEEEIEARQAEIDYSYQQFKVRLRALQVNDDASTLGLIIGADSFADFLSRTETVNRIADHDRALMQRLTEQRQELEEAKTILEEARQRVLADKEETEEKKQVLGVQLNAAQASVQNLEKMEQEFLADLAKNEAAAKKMEADLNAIYEKIKWDESPYVGGAMAWPLPGHTQITSAYGYRFSGRDFHTGMDIAGGSPYGKPIVAANDGTVKFVNWTYTQGSGYGIYLIIDHGGGISTLYAHCSSLSVGVGDQVKRGQEVAKVGSTGWSTGPHLHFEVRVNGQHTNPYSYVTSR